MKHIPVADPVQDQGVGEVGQSTEAMVNSQSKSFRVQAL